MTDQNNAAQAATQSVLTDDDVEEIRHDWDCFFRKSTEGGAPLCIRDIEHRVLSKLRAPVADERKEIAGVTLDGCLETLFRVGEHLGIDYAESRKQPGAPSGIYIKAIEDRVSQAMNAAREEAARLMEQTSRSSGATLIRSLASAPVADERAVLVSLSSLHEEAGKMARSWSDNLRVFAGPPTDDEIDAYEEGYLACALSRRAALASAPVAGKTKEAVDYVRGGALNFDAHPDGAPVARERDPGEILKYLEGRIESAQLAPGLLKEVQAGIGEASVLVAGEAVAEVNKLIKCEISFTPHGIKSKLPHGTKLYAAPQARPSDGDLWDQTLKERDHYHDMADRLANAIGAYFGQDAGEHSSSHCPWHEALGIIGDAAPQASEADAAALSTAVDYRRMDDTQVGASEHLAKLAAALGNRDWKWWDSCSFRRLTFADGPDRRDGGALCGWVQPSDGHPDVSMAPGVREFIEAASPKAIAALAAAYMAALPAQPGAQKERSDGR